MAEPNRLKRMVLLAVDALLFVIEGRLFFLLSNESLFEIGQTAITDSMYLSHVNGLSMWYQPPGPYALEWVQWLTSASVIISTVLAALDRARRATFLWAAAVSVSAGFSAAWAHAWVIGDEPLDWTPMDDDLSCVLSLVCCFALHALLVARASGVLRSSAVPTAG